MGILTCFKAVPLTDWSNATEPSSDLCDLVVTMTKLNSFIIFNSEYKGHNFIMNVNGSESVHPDPQSLKSTIFKSTRLPAHCVCVFKCANYYVSCCTLSNLKFYLLGVFNINILAVLVLYLLSRCYNRHTSVQRFTMYTAMLPSPCFSEETTLCLCWRKMHIFDSRHKFLSTKQCSIIVEPINLLQTYLFIYLSFFSFINWLIGWSEWFPPWCHLLSPHSHTWSMVVVSSWFQANILLQSMQRFWLD